VSDSDRKEHERRRTLESPMSSLPCRVVERRRRRFHQSVNRRLQRGGRQVTRAGRVRAIGSLLLRARCIGDLRELASNWRCTSRSVAVARSSRRARRRVHSELPRAGRVRFVMAGEDWHASPEILRFSSVVAGERNPWIANPEGIVKRYIGDRSDVVDAPPGGGLTMVARWAVACATWNFGSVGCS